MICRATWTESDNSDSYLSGISVPHPPSSPRHWINMGNIFGGIIILPCLLLLMPAWRRSRRTNFSDIPPRPEWLGREKNARTVRANSDCWCWTMRMAPAGEWKCSECLSKWLVQQVWVQIKVLQFSLLTLTGGNLSGSANGEAFNAKVRSIKD